MGKDNYSKVEDLFIELMSSTVKDVIGTIKSGEATPQDIRNAITLLKDNGFTMRDVPSDMDPNKFIEEISSIKLPQISLSGDIIDGVVED
jgi:methanogenic corrinoid protein MtbC1